MFLFLITAILMVLPAYAQSVTGAMVGTVQDRGGSAIAGADITLLHIATGRQRHTVSEANGDFVFSGLESGEYALIISKQGFKRVERRNLMLATGERFPAGTIVLEVGDLSETVSISAAGGTIVQTQSSERADVITSAQVENLTIIGRDVKSLVSLVPGIVNFTNPANPTNRFEFNALGNRNTTNNVTVDGTPITSTDFPAEHNMPVSQDAISEVKILVSNFQAEFGRLSGAGLALVIKSGTKDFHGLASYFKRHEQFNANNFFNNRDGSPKPRYRFNTWTWNLGGPVYIPRLFNQNKDKLFFFFNQEFWPQKNTTIQRVTVPTELERAGDFSQSVDLNNRKIVVRDPSNNRNPFPENRIPAHQLDPSGVALLRSFPLPNFFDRAISQGQYNYISSFPTSSLARYDALKLDYNWGAHNFLSGSYLANTSDSESGGRGNWPQFPTTGSARDRTYSLRYTRVISPTIVNEFQVGMMESVFVTTSTEEILRRNQRDAAGFVAGQLFPSANEQNLLPNATFGGVPTFADRDLLDRHPFAAYLRNAIVSDKLSITRGPHSIKTGFSIERNVRGMRIQGTRPFGTIDFGVDANNPLDTGYAYANAALGVFRSYQESSARPWISALSGLTEAFAQDNWKVTRRLTLDVGVRMTYFAPMYDRDNFLSGFVSSQYDPSQQVQLIGPGRDESGRRVGVHPVTGQRYPAALIGAIAPGTGDPFNGMVDVSTDTSYPRALTNDQGLRFAPRFGFAYDVFEDGKTAVRGGFGVFYNRDSMDSTYKPFSGLPPHVVTPTIQYGQLSQLQSSTALLFPNVVSGRYFDEEVPKTMNFSLSIQRDIGWGTVVDVAYVGALGRNLIWRRSLNPVPAGARFRPENRDPTNGSPLPDAFLRPIIGYQDIQVVEPGSSSNYHSMQISARRRFARGLQFGFAWTWSKAMDYNDNDTQGPVSALVPVREWNYGLAGFDRTHVVKINYVYELPKVSAGHVILNHILNGWQLSGITTLQSGAPLNVSWTTTTPVDITGTPTQNARIDMIGNPVLSKDERTFERFFRTESFRLPQVGTFGNGGKVQFRGPGLHNWDIGITRNFKFTERLKSQFRLEMYNAFNHTQFTAVDIAARFNPATGEQVNARFGQYTTAAGARIMQMSLRISF
jgi:Carboxypeptidase regulatory-like domain